MAIDKASTHYDAGGIETLTFIRAKLTPEQYEGFLLGNILKYTSRCNYKNSKTRDFEKIAVYANELKALKASPNTGTVTLSGDWLNGLRS